MVSTRRCWGFWCGSRRVLDGVLCHLAAYRPLQPYCDGAPVHYERHRSEQTTLYRLVQQHAQSFFAQAEEALGASLPKFVKDEFDAFLKCGILAHGYTAAPGNYLSFVSSFDYVQQLVELFRLTTVMPARRCASFFPAGGKWSTSSRPPSTSQLPRHQHGNVDRFALSAVPDLVPATGAVGHHNRVGLLAHRRQ